MSVAAVTMNAVAKETASVFMDSVLKPVFEDFCQNIANDGIKTAMDYLKNEVGMDDAGNDIQNDRDNGIVRQIEKEYGVVRDDAVFFMQECARVVSDIYTCSENISDKRAILETMRDTDLPSNVRNDACLSVANEAMKNHDAELMKLACFETDGLNIQDYENIKEQVAGIFGKETAYEAEISIRLKENPQRMLGELANKLKDGEISTSEYLNQLAVMGSLLPDNYRNSIAIEIMTAENPQGSFDFKIETGDWLETGCDTIGIETGEAETDSEKLTIGKEDAVNAIHKFHIKGDNALDVICEVNVPPTDPTFVSELAQKFANFVSAQALSVGDTDKEKHKLSSILPDDQRATFDDRVDDLSKEQKSQLQDGLNEQHEDIAEDYADYNDEYIDNGYSYEEDEQEKEDEYETII